MIQALLACLALAAPPAPPATVPPGSCAGPDALAAWVGKAATPVKAWAEYAPLVDGKPKLDKPFRVYLVDTGTKGKPQRWLEMAEKGGKTAYRVPLDGQNGDAPLMKQGRAVFAMPAGAAGQTEVAKACGAASGAKQALRREVIDTPAGRFPTRYLKKSSGAHALEYWISDEVPPLGLVKVKLPFSGGLVLLAKGTDAVSAFLEQFTPTPFPTLESVEALLPQDRPKKVEKALAAPSADGGTPPGTAAGRVE